MSQRDFAALEAAIAGVAAFLPEEVAKALAPAADDENEEEMEEPGEGQPAPGGAPGAPPAAAAPPAGAPGAPEVHKAADETIEVAEMDAEVLFGAIGREVHKAVADSEGRILGDLDRRLSRIERAMVAGLEVHKAVSSALKLAARTPAATPAGPGLAASSFRAPTDSPAGRHIGPTGDGGKPLDFGEVMKAVSEGIIEAPEGTVYTNTGELPRKLTPDAIRAQLTPAGK